MDKEIRSIGIADSELRAARRGRTIEGRAIVFNSESRDLGGFTEVIDPGAFDEILPVSDVVALFNHDMGRGVLARYTNGEGTLELWKDQRGINYRFDAPDTPLGDEVLSGIRRNDIRASSFSFKCREEDNQKWEKKPDGSWLRTVKKIEGFFDVSPVVFEAYQDTTAAVRSLVEIRTSEAEQKAAEALKEAEEARKRAANLEAEQRAKATPSESTEVQQPEDLTEYFKNLRKQIPKK